MGLGMYVLKGHEPIPEPDTIKWGRWMEKADRRVDRTDFPNGVWVSTVFLGLDHNFSGGRPLLFETMIFGTDPESEMRESYQDRCSTWDEAVEMHKRAVYMTAERYLEEHARHHSTEESTD